MEGKTLPMKMNLQFFAADPARDAADPAAEGTGTAETGDMAEETGQGTADPAGAEKENAEEEKKDRDGQSGSIAENVQKLVQEEIKKAAMSPEERAAYETEEKEKSLKEREDAISLRERMADAKELLAENGLPVNFTAMVMGEDKMATEKNVKALKAQFDASVQAQVEKRLGGRTPEAGSGVSGGDSTLEDEIMRYL